MHKEVVEGGAYVYAIVDNDNDNGFVLFMFVGRDNLATSNQQLPTPAYTLLSLVLLKA